MYLLLDNFLQHVRKDGVEKRPVNTGKAFYISRCGGFVRDGTWKAN